jgi:DNA-binding MarR family transcriptional regulator
MVYYELREEFGLGRIAEPPRLSELSKRYDKTVTAISKWLTVLEGAGLIERETHRPYEGRAIVLLPVPERDRFRPCVRCGVRERRANTGNKCARCKELTRKGRRWHREAIHLAMQGHGETAIYCKLVKKYPEIHIHDTPPDPDEPGSRGTKGIITVLNEVALATPEWLEAQREGPGSLDQQRMRRVRRRREDAARNREGED